MPTTDELHAADQKHAEAIAALEARMDGNEKRLTGTERAIEKLNESVAMLREAVAKVATKDDIIKLAEKIDEKFDRQLRDARNSIPGKVAAVTGGAMFLLTLVTVVVNVLRHG